MTATDEKQLYVGDMWEVEADILRTRTGIAVDPAGLVARVKLPDGSEQNATLTKLAGTGKWIATILLTLAGTWHMTWVGPEGEDRGVETISRRVLIAPLGP